MSPSWKELRINFIDRRFEENVLKKHFAVNVKFKVEVHSEETTCEWERVQLFSAL